MNLRFNIGGAAVSLMMVMAVPAFALHSPHEAHSPANSKSQSKGQAPEAIPGEVIVRLRGEGLISHIEQMHSVAGQTILSVRPLVTDDRYAKVTLARADGVAAAIRGLEEHPLVKYAEPNYVYRITGGLPNDPDFAKLWGLKNTGQADAAGQVGVEGADIDVVPVWQEGHTGSKDVIVAVIDTGIDWDHPDLAANLYKNSREIDGNGIDDDGNGFVDDVHGWNFYDNTRNSDDDHDHGTHCAGTIGGVGNNGKGVAGVAWSVTLMPVKFLSSFGSGSLEGAVNSINYATKMGVHIMSNSWGGGGFSQALKDSIEAAKAKGILFVAAAGNETNDNDGSPTYPATYDVDNVVAVAATDNRDQLAYFSNWGRTKVHVAAPGVKVWSTTKGGTYQAFSGTSMATPHVSGVAALMMASFPSMTYADIKDRMIRTSDPVPALRRKVVARGRVNVSNAFKNIVPPSDEPDESAWQNVAKHIESSHPYANDEEEVFEVRHPGASHIRVHFEKVDTERRYDKVFVEDAAGTQIDVITGKADGYMSDYVTGDTVRIRLKADSSVNGWGFKVDRIQVIMPSEIE